MRGRQAVACVWGSQLDGPGPPHHDAPARSAPRDL